MLSQENSEFVTHINILILRFYRNAKGLKIFFSIKTTNREKKTKQKKTNKRQIVPNFRKYR